MSDEEEKVMMYEYIATYFIATCLIYDEEVNKDNFDLYLGEILDDVGLTGIKFEDVEKHSSDIRKVFGVVQSEQDAVSVSEAQQNKREYGVVNQSNNLWSKPGDHRVVNNLILNKNPASGGGVRRKVKTQAKGKGKTQPTKIRKNKRGGGDDLKLSILRKFLKFMGKKNKVVVEPVATYVVAPNGTVEANSLYEYEYTNVESITVNLQELKLIDMLKLIALRKHNPANYPGQLKEFIAYLNGQDVDITTVNKYLQQLQDMQKQIRKRNEISPGLTMYNNSTFKSYIENICRTFVKNDDRTTKEASSDFIISIISKVFESTQTIYTNENEARHLAFIATKIYEEFKYRDETVLKAVKDGNLNAFCKLVNPSFFNDKFIYVFQYLNQINDIFPLNFPPGVNDALTKYIEANRETEKDAIEDYLKHFANHVNLLIDRCSDKNSSELNLIRNLLYFIPGAYSQELQLTKSTSKIIDTDDLSRYKYLLSELIKIINGVWNKTITINTGADYKKSTIVKTQITDFDSSPKNIKETLYDLTRYVGHEFFSRFVYKEYLNPTFATVSTVLNNFNAFSFNKYSAEEDADILSFYKQGNKYDLEYLKGVLCINYMIHKYISYNIHKSAISIIMGVNAGSLKVNHEDYAKITNDVEHLFTNSAVIYSTRAAYYEIALQALNKANADILAGNPISLEGAMAKFLAATGFENVQSAESFNQINKNKMELHKVYLVLLIKLFKVGKYWDDVDFLTSLDTPLKLAIYYEAFTGNKESLNEIKNSNVDDPDAMINAITTKANALTSGTYKRAVEAELNKLTIFTSIATLSVTDLAVDILQIHQHLEAEDGQGGGGGGGKIVKKYIPDLYTCNDKIKRRAYRVAGQGNKLFVKYKGEHTRVCNIPVKKTSKK